MRYDFLVETYATERIKVSACGASSVTTIFPCARRDDPRGRSVHEQMVHQCVKRRLVVSHHAGIDVEALPLAPSREPTAIHETVRAGLAENAIRLERTSST